MSHIPIIIDSITDLQGENVTGTGTLETLRYHLNTHVAAIEEMPPASWTPAQAAVMAKTEDIESMFVGGFTAADLADAVNDLKDLCEAL